MRESAPYTRLAAGYDLVMEHVDYAEWARLVHGLLRTYGERVSSILELGCGTGSLAMELQPLGGYRYVATDRSEAMLRVARSKAATVGADVAFEAADFAGFRVDRPMDAALLLFDSINYLLDDVSLGRLFACTRRALKSRGLFVFDLSTPVNSLNNAAFFEDEGEAEGFRYRRLSSFDVTTGIHTTTFEMELSGRTYREEHRQRAYPVDAVRAQAEAAGFEVLAVLDGFSQEPADAATERAHFVTRRPPFRETRS